MKLNTNKPADVTPLHADRPPVDRVVKRDESRTYSRHELVARVWRVGASCVLAGFLAGLATMFLVVAAFSAAESNRTAETFSRGVAIGQATARP